MTPKRLSHPLFSWKYDDDFCFTPVLCNKDFSIFLGMLDMYRLFWNNIQVPTLTLVFNTLNPGNIEPVCIAKISIINKELKAGTQHKQTSCHIPVAHMCLFIWQRHKTRHLCHTLIVLCCPGCKPIMCQFLETRWRHHSCWKARDQRHWS